MGMYAVDVWPAGSLAGLLLIQDGTFELDPALTSYQVAKWSYYFKLDFSNWANEYYNATILYSTISPIICIHQNKHFALRKRIVYTLRKLQYHTTAHMCSITHLTVSSPA